MPQRRAKRPDGGTFPPPARRTSVKRFWLLLVTLAVAGCGAQAAGPGPSPTGTVSGTNGPFYAEASPAKLAAGGSVHLTLTVTGPIDYEIGCVQTLHIWAENSQRQQVWQEPVLAVMCMAIGHQVLAAGETATFAADWPTSSTLAPGSYTLHGLFLVVLPIGAAARVRENLAPLTIQISR